MFALEAPLWETFLRGTVVYLAITLIVRFLPKRHMGKLSPNDVIALVIIGDLAGHAIVGEARAILDVLLLIVVVIFWDYVFNLLEYYFPRLRRVAQASPTLLIHNGHLLGENLRKEKLTEEELAANLRKQGVPDIAKVKQAVLETDGQITVIENEDNQT
jgi:uncharacterized membrane protein YcaP (DUF421 family)